MHKYSRLILSLIAFGALFIGGNIIQPNSSKAANAYDISQWQGYINNNQASQLKHEVNFMVLKGENGGIYGDTQFNHNAYEMSSHHIPYGAYDYSVYANPAQAGAEAQALYRRAPHADFYANDSEENDVGSYRQYNLSTQRWADALKSLTNKPVVLYSGLYYMNNNISQATRNHYDAIWLAAYGVEPDPYYHYDLWQSTDSHYSPALRERVDADVFPNGNNKSLSFWTGKSNINYNQNNNSNYNSNNPTNIPKKPVNTFNYKAHRRAIRKVQRIDNTIMPQYSSNQQELISDRVTLNNLQNRLKNISMTIQGHHHLLGLVANLSNNISIKLRNIDGINNYQIQQQQIAKQKAKKLRRQALKRKHHRRRHLRRRKHARRDNGGAGILIGSNQRRKHVNRKNRNRKRKKRVIRRRKRKVLWNLYHNYYRDSHIHTLRVRRTLRVYTKNSGYQYYLHAHRGDKIHHVHFVRTLWHHQMITRAYGKFDGYKVQLTSHKGWVKGIL